MTGRLARRLAQLEALAARIRLLELAEPMAREIGCSVEELIETAEEISARFDRMRSAGSSKRRIVEAMAAEIGADPDELLARCGGPAAEGPR